MVHFPRLLGRQLEAALTDTPAILVTGARQVGKSTLVRNCVPGAAYVTLDDQLEESAARSDPAGFLDRHSAPTLVIDEIQRAPALMQALKLSIDRDRRPGAFVLTGSADILMLPRVSESLAGRMDVLILRPFAQLEVTGRALPTDTFVDAIFAKTKLPQWRRHVGRTQMFERMLVGGYPESRTRVDARRRLAWFRSYVAELLQREVRDIARVADLARLSRLLALVAARSTQPINKARLASDLGLSWNTVDTYLAILQTMFLIIDVGAWSRSSNARISRHGKILVSDSGLAGSLLGLERETVLESGTPLGSLVETFVGNELLRLQSGTSFDFELLHYRTQRGEEVDFVIEQRGGALVGIEVKASATVTAADFRGIDALRRDAGEDFVRGVVLYTGENTASFGDERYAVPISALWDEPTR